MANRATGRLFLIIHLRWKASFVDKCTSFGHMVRVIDRENGNRRTTYVGNTVQNCASPPKMNVPPIVPRVE